MDDPVDLESARERIAELKEALAIVTDLYAALFRDTYPDLNPENVDAIMIARRQLC